MAEMAFRRKIAILIAPILISLLTDKALSQDVPAEQCSLAIVSRLLNNNQRVCDGRIVRAMAQHGRMFEQSQMGISSILAIGPDYSEKKALNWLKREARRGYAPAQVNLAVMYVNGWGMPVNNPAAVKWLQAAADQKFARAYYNLGILSLEGRGMPQN